LPSHFNIFSENFHSNKEPEVEKIPAKIEKEMPSPPKKEEENKRVKPPSTRVNMSAIVDREQDIVNMSMQESQKEDKDKINKTFNSGTGSSKPSKAPKITTDSQQKARKLL
jgi:hypothetical protein